MSQDEAVLPPVARESWFQYLWYEATAISGMAAMTLGWGLRLKGEQNVPATGPVLVIANHQSFFDPLLVGLAVRRHLRYLARKTLFKRPLFTWLIGQYNAVPIDQEGVGKEGIKAILEQLQGGCAVLVFPEGERTHDGAIHPLRPGVHLLIKRGGAPVVPVGIAGAFGAWPRWRPLPVPAPLFLPAAAGTIAVVIGRPIEAQRFAGLDREQVLDELFEELRRVQDRAERLRRKAE